MNPVLLLPIERLPLRYSSDWAEWFCEALSEEDRQYQVFGDNRARKIEVGQFLDAYETNIYKMRQLQGLLERLKEVDEPVTILALDGWFPGIEVLGYLKAVARVPLYVCGIFHAGTYDHHDYLHQMGCSHWGRPLEASWLRIYDEIFVATDYHRELLLSRFAGVTARITVVQFPVMQSQTAAEKENLVVFPHRLSWEKQPDEFEALQGVFFKRHADIYPHVQWVRSMDLRDQYESDELFKEAYYELLARASVVFSSALQETFGIAMLEGWAHDAWPVAPDRLSYRETLAAFPRYRNMVEAADLVAQYLKTDVLPPGSPFTEDVRHIVRKLP